MEEERILFIFLFLSTCLPMYVRSQQGQPPGFLSIDCGLPEGADYRDSGNTELTYVSDAGYVETGEIGEISPEYATEDIRQTYRNLRSFPDGGRNCYRLPVDKGSKYLVRAGFMYGNYDGKSSVPTFDLYLGAEKWSSIKYLGRAENIWWDDAVTVATQGMIWVCLVNIGLGTPFISYLELRPLTNSLYPAANATQFLVLWIRYDPGAPNDTEVRYPNDAYDRIWDSFISTDWSSLNVSLDVDNSGDIGFEPPSEVMRTAARPVGDSGDIRFEYSSYMTSKSFIYIHFAELETLAVNESRQFWVFLNDKLWYNEPYIPSYLLASTLYNPEPLVDKTTKYAIKMNRTANSTHPPIFNGVEMYDLQELTQALTSDDDIDAIMDIKIVFRMKGNWVGDPCVPSRFIWQGLNCSYLASNPAKIISLNLSSKGLRGTIPSSLANLKSLLFLDLSNNNLSGRLPEFLADMLTLKFINVENNKLTGQIPNPLQEKNRTGELSLSVGNNPGLCASPPCTEEVVDGPCQSDSCGKKGRKVAVSAIVGSVIGSILVVAIGLFILWKVRQRRQVKNPTLAVDNKKESATSSGSFNLDNRRVAYVELASITNNFSRVLGRGGFGVVYHGQMKDGTEVAVKMLNKNWRGTTEFQTEAQLLTRVYHRNLVQLVGYCADGKNLALILEYMPQGNLAQALSGSENVLSWVQRLLIALDIAQGLEYLHVGCKPPIIHRDVKPTNILLNDKFEAKIADFGLSKVFFSDDNVTHVSTAVKGTRGYLDPEYCFSNNLNEKSDVYAFGIVLMELITGKSAIIQVSESEKICILEWVEPVIFRGDIRSVVDSRLGEDFNINSAWAALDVAIACSRSKNTQRPTMSNVVAQLKECLNVDHKVAERSGSLINYEEHDNGNSENSMLHPTAR